MPQSSQESPAGCIDFAALDEQRRREAREARERQLFSPEHIESCRLLGEAMIRYEAHFREQLVQPAVEA
ncbi:MAG TPA: hypothetical protein VMR18_02730 [Candidatus Saccharimonadales bacterium]|jgi:hypothetical protein|nr:hypothetical protein [Candidatus Saccharimonadales bacterium]